jgi:DNA-binding transcriptional regulator YiaG
MTKELIFADKVSSLTVGVLTKNEIKLIRQSFGLTQTNFSDLLGVKYNNYSSWESGYKNPSSPALTLMHVAKNTLKYL